MIFRWYQIIEVQSSFLPHEFVIVHAALNVRAHDRKFVDWFPLDTGRIDPSAWKQLAFLDLYVDNLVHLLQSHSGYDSVNKQGRCIFGYLSLETKPTDSVNFIQFS